MSAAAPLQLDVIPDVVCPWCFVGKRRLERAIAAVPVRARLRWRPFQLDPTIPPEGKSRRAYLEGKFGTQERIDALLDALTEAGDAEGIPFAFDRIDVSPNTLDAHRLIRWAGEAEKQDAIVEALFTAYFLDGRDIGDHDVLADIAADAGMDGAQVLVRLSSDDDRAAVEAEIKQAYEIGVTGVPTLVVLGRYAIVGAQPSTEIAQALETIAARERLATGAAVNA